MTHLVGVRMQPEIFCKNIIWFKKYFSSPLYVGGVSWKLGANRVEVRVQNSVGEQEELVHKVGVIVWEVGGGGCETGEVRQLLVLRVGVVRGGGGDGREGGYGGLGGEARWWPEWRAVEHRGLGVGYGRYELEIRIGAMLFIQLHEWTVAMIAFSRFLDIFFVFLFIGSCFKRLFFRGRSIIVIVILQNIPKCMQLSFGWMRGVVWLLDVFVPSLTEPGCLVSSRRIELIQQRTVPRCGAVAGGGGGPSPRAGSWWWEILLCALAGFGDSLTVRPFLLAVCFLPSPGPSPNPALFVDFSLITRINDRRGWRLRAGG